MLVLLLASAALAAESGVGLYLWELGEQPLAGTSLDDSPILVELEFTDPEAAAGRLTSHATTSVADISERSVRLLVRASESVRAEPAASDLEATFVIDYDEPPLPRLSRRRGRTTAQPKTSGGSSTSTSATRPTLAATTLRPAWRARVPATAPSTPFC